MVAVMSFVLLRVVVLVGRRVADSDHFRKEEMQSISFHRGMELRQLRVLQAVGETGSFSAAADLLDYTQPAVSKIVAGLEQQVGTTLVDRGLRPLRLTEAGSALARRAGAVFEQLAVAELEL